MKYLKITNIISPIGEMDYKGVDISKFIGGSQVYADDLNTLYVVTKEEDINESNGVEILTEEDYINIRENHINKVKQESQTNEQRLADLEIAMAAIMGGAL